MQETWVRSLDKEDPLEKETAAHSSVPAWEIPDQRSLVGYSPCGHSQTQLSIHTRTNPVFIGPFVEEVILSPLCTFGILVQDPLTIYAWIYFWALFCSLASVLKSVSSNFKE